MTKTGAIYIGLITGIVSISAQDFIEKILKIIDPVAAVAVHGVERCHRHHLRCALC